MTAEVEQDRHDIEHESEFTQWEAIAEIYKHRLLIAQQAAKAWEAWIVFTKVEHRINQMPHKSLRTAQQQRTVDKYIEIATRERAEFDRILKGTSDFEVEEALAYDDKLTEELLRNVE